MKLNVTVNPNPFTAELTVLIESDVSLNAVLRLTDNKENLVRMMGCPLVNGENRVLIKNLSKYVIGNYQLEVKLLNGEMVEIIKLTKE